MLVVLTLITAGLAAFFVWSFLSKPVPGCTPYRGKSIKERTEGSNKPEGDGD